MVGGWEELSRISHRAVSQYGWGVTVQTSDYWRELLRAAISHTCCMLDCLVVAGEK